VAVAGRSNCGKSSLINKLVGRKRLARVSQVPGKTREINFYLINDRFFLTDLPGYGFAHWNMLIENFLTDNADLVGIIVLIDARRGLLAQDEQLLNWLADLQIPALFALTKIDKLNRIGRKKAEAALQKDLALNADQVIATSAHSGEGVDTLRESLFALVDSFAAEAV